MKRIILFLAIVGLAASCQTLKRQVNKSRVHTDSTGVKKDDSTGVKKDDSTGVKKDDSTGVKKNDSTTKVYSERGVDTTLTITGDTTVLRFNVADFEALPPGGTLVFQTGSKAIEVKKVGQSGSFEVVVMDKPKKLTINTKEKRYEERSYSNTDSARTSSSDSTTVSSSDSTTVSSSDSTSLEQDSKSVHKDVQRRSVPWWIYALLIVVVFYVVYYFTGFNPLKWIWKFFTTKKRHGG